MAEKALVHRMEQAALTTKIRLLDLAHQTLIHIGGDLSVCDMMTAIWQYAIHYDVKNPHWEGRDRFVLSKGHAAAVTSFSQAAIGCYDVGDIYKEYATNFGRFGMHSCNLANPYVDVSTGSLGHSFPVACGMATALKRKGSSSRVYTVVGDGECGEGSIWEAAMYANQKKLDNLIVFTDYNNVLRRPNRGIHGAGTVRRQVARVRLEHRHHRRPRHERHPGRHRRAARTRF